MKNSIRNFVVLLLVFISLASCGDLKREVENNLNDLKKKAESLDSLVNKEVDKVLALDSLINLESDKVKKLDSLINKSSSRLDSISNEKIESLEKLLN